MMSTPVELRQQLEHAVDEIIAGLPSKVDSWLEPERRKQLKTVVLASPFVGQLIVRDVEILTRLSEHDEWAVEPSREHLKTLLETALDAAEDEVALYAALRRFRRTRMAGIIWRDLTGQADAWATARAVTLLAELCLDGALTWLENHYAQRWGRPALMDNGERTRLVVLGMGKFGAGELNLSSDIDLIFAFERRGVTEGGRRSLDHQEYFTRIGQKLIAALDQITADGFVFRVDMRLRPLGDGGPLVNPFSTTTSYYQDQGREWERFALLKARPVAGDRAAGARLLDELKPFMYRKYIDFGAIESLREMKGLINREVRRRDIEDNIKLGRGGIREVEFVVQAFQLIRGGRDRELQTPSLKQALDVLKPLELLPASAVDELHDDYVFLRDLEHAIQAQYDRQTQALPEEALDQLRLAYAMGEPSWAALFDRLEQSRARVRTHFDAVVAAPDEDADARSALDPALEQWRSLWEQSLSDTEALALMARHGFDDAERSLNRLYRLKHGKSVINMQRVGFERLDALMPMLIAEVAATEAPTRTLERVLPLIEAVLRRTAYLSLLRENPDALRQFVRLCGASAWIAEQIARYPMLLDEMLSPALLGVSPSRETLTHELRQALARIPDDDDEALIEALRHFRHAKVLHVAAGEVAGVHDIMTISDSLTMIAEVVLEAVLGMAWRSLTHKHGVPEGHERGPKFSIIGYGKLGGIELGYGSDLDLVFLFEPSTASQTPGPRAIDAPVFFTRLGQRIIHLLTAVTPAGVLYEVDMRLRPSGNAGLLVSTLDAFADYQHHHAWTWEHQALVRARPVAGNQALAERFETLRRDVLSKARDDARLKQEVVEMRDKMRAHLGSDAQARASSRFHLKQDPGGLVDIEFLNQYMVLAHSHETGALLAFTDNIRLIETLESSGQMALADADMLRNAYLAYRRETHRMALNNEKSLTDASMFDAERAGVTAVWKHWMGQDLAASGSDTPT
ncbi:bifunctional [glutamate--ammonia ligase]-adenylyl-L-tyrosine phosphorylase/[glutamate--ammonia-ligase] adenylyltransferase [Larsenimonas salina]|uniref:bifunctional [glutamate--ammonia ligase]-adenylyl-L-tyrosine phosphorylase/[glutamate--ammonia-ligase] adenylyltransferase n=1 Tax=Larsenimonas salina TaxID=1295565 RepID=UPI0020742CD5|nr:bifunctional [glutamate--ammonia ligase]-adenylyl-L-tyrosine phosphorylase/[glutamate--ammonia-ligase] adenylyltransferase [Larsenimonas salina]MCM5704272.1 bifunctional [glutamate--ammonia ligase]-adenylyl-L-tyrosine phosphorylase/[glutamate--ammonia-ligase] adenylyltransferase [Larsenimonas salina]